MSGYTWGIPGSAEALTALPPYSLMRLRKECQNMPPLVIGVLPDTNSKKKHLSISCELLCDHFVLNLTLATDVLKRYTAPRPFVLAAVKWHISSANRNTRVSFISPASGASKVRTFSTTITEELESTFTRVEELTSWENVPTVQER